MRCVFGLGRVRRLGVVLLVGVSSTWRQTGVRGNNQSPLGGNSGVVETPLPEQLGSSSDGRPNSRGQVWVLALLCYWVARLTFGACSYQSCLPEFEGDINGVTTRQSSVQQWQVMSSSWSVTEGSSLHRLSKEVGIENSEIVIPGYMSDSTFANS